MLFSRFGMKKIGLVILVILLGGGAFYYYKKSSSANYVITELVPDNTLVLIETSHWTDFKQAVKGLPVPILQQLPEQAHLLTDIGFTNEEINKLFEQKLIYLAVLPQTKEALSLVNYLPLNSDDEAFLEKFLSIGKNAEQYRKITHTTQGQKIHEIYNHETQLLVAYTIFNDILVFSQSTLSLEEILLHKNHAWVSSLSLANPVLNEHSNVCISHVNPLAFERYGKQLVQKHTAMPYLGQVLQGSWQWDSQQLKQSQILSKSTSPSNLFKQQDKAFDMAQVVPNNTALLLYVPVDNASALQETVQQQIKANEFLRKLAEKAQDEFDLDLEGFTKRITGDILLVNTETGYADKNNKILLIKNSSLANELKKYASDVADKNDTSVMTLQFGGYTLFSLGIREFPALTLGPLFYGFSECYFTTYKDYLVIASNFSCLQDYLQSLSQTEVWVNSQKHQQLLKNCKPAGLTFILDHTKSFQSLNSIIASTLQEAVASNEENLGNIDYTIVQQREEENTWLTLLNKGGSSSGPTSGGSLVKLSSKAQNIGFKPFSVINPWSKKQELLIQDQGNQLHLLVDGKDVWKYKLGSKLLDSPKFMKTKGDHDQILLLATANKLYKLTRKDKEKGFTVLSSEYIEGLTAKGFALFEKSASSSDFSLLNANGAFFHLKKNTLELIEQDHVTEDTGTLFLPIPTLLIKGNIYALCVDDNGIAQLIDSEGNMADGFPVYTSITDSNPIIEVNDGKVTIVIVGSRGELTRFNTTGAVTQTNQFFRPDNAYKFQAIHSDKLNDWVVVRSDGKIVTFLDTNDKELFTVKDLPFGKKTYYYYNLGLGKKFYAIANGNAYYLYNEQGQALNKRPFVSISQPNVTYAESYNKLIIETHTSYSYETWGIKLGQ